MRCTPLLNWLNWYSDIMRCLFLFYCTVLRKKIDGIFTDFHGVLSIFRYICIFLYFYFFDVYDFLVVYLFAVFIPHRWS